MGNTPLLTLSETSATLYVGGWSRQARPYKGWGIIDLTGTEKPTGNEVEAINPSGRNAFGGVLNAVKVDYGPWLSLPIQDYSVPKWGPKVWAALATDIKVLLEGGTDVLMCCAGGHGRTGLAASILIYILRPDLCEKEHPIDVVRRIHCREAVETNSQIDYVCDILEKFGLDRATGDHILVPISKSGYSYVPKGGVVSKEKTESGSKLVWNYNDHQKRGGLMETWTNTFGL